MPRSKAAAPLTIIKRNGSIVPFQMKKIAIAAEKAMRAAEEFRAGAPEKIAEAVFKKIEAQIGAGTLARPTVEMVQDIVEHELMVQKFTSAAKAYILYRAEHAELRKEQEDVSPEIQQLVADSKKYFPNQLSEYVFYSSYARWLDDKGRRETWIETIDRYIAFMKENLGAKLKKSEY